MNESIKVAVAEYFQVQEAEEVLAFLERGFPAPGQRDVAAVALYAKRHGKTLREIMAYLKAQWEARWAEQPFSLRANLDCGNGILVAEKALDTVMLSLDLPRFRQRGGDVPSWAFVAKCKGVTYTFGAADRHGERDVARHCEEPLPFRRCAIEHVAECDRMILLPVGMTDGKKWPTSAIFSIRRQ